ncbi:MAG: tetratricopeptide repeat protein [Proteobacteria bacterium]|nr:tetratricopeptide repeat protein [Pseudomonadota bacterium]
MINSPKKDIPPGLIRILKEGRPSKKFFIILGVSSFLVIIGFALVYYYNVYYPINTSQIEKRQSLVTQNAQTVNQTPVAVEQNTEIKQRQETSLKEQKLTMPSEKQNFGEIKNIKQPALSFDKKQKEVSIMSIDTFKGADYLYRAQDFEQKGLLADAINEYKEYINYTGKADEKILNKIATLYLLSGNLKEANHYADLVYKSSKNSKEVLINYGVIKAKLGEIEKAEECFNRVLVIDPNNKNALYNLALIKEQKGEYKEAFKIYERLYQLGDLSVITSIERLKDK